MRATKKSHFVGWARARARHFYKSKPLVRRAHHHRSKLAYTKMVGTAHDSLNVQKHRASAFAHPTSQCPPHRPVRASECTQPCMRDLAFSMSCFVKKSSGFTLSTG